MPGPRPEAAESGPTASPSTCSCPGARTNTCACTCPGTHPGTFAGPCSFTCTRTGCTHAGSQ